MQTNLDKFFKTSTSLEKEGVWFRISDGVGFLVRPFRASNQSVKAAMAKYYKPYARQIEMGTLDVSKALEINIKVFVNACLVNWEGLKDEKGKEIEFTPENALTLFAEMPALFDTLWAHCQDYKNYQEEVGNS